MPRQNYFAGVTELTSIPTPFTVPVTLDPLVAEMQNTNAAAVAAVPVVVERATALIAEPPE